VSELRREAKEKVRSLRKQLAVLDKLTGGASERERDVERKREQRAAAKEVIIPPCADRQRVPACARRRAAEELVSASRTRNLAGDPKDHQASAAHRMLQAGRSPARAGLQQTRIAARFGASQATVSSDLKLIEEQWRADAVRDFKPHVGRLLEQLRSLPGLARLATIRAARRRSRFATSTAIFGSWLW
jgi:hypothetical protein